MFIIAFGIQCFEIEIYTRKDPYPDMDAVQVATKVGRGELTIPIPSNAPTEIANVMKLCSRWNDKQRPSMKEICQELTPMFGGDIIAQR